MSARAKARSRLASTLSDAASVLPLQDRREFRAFLRRLANGEEVADVRPPKRRGKWAARAREKRKPVQETLPGFEH